MSGDGKVPWVVRATGRVGGHHLGRRHYREALALIDKAGETDPETGRSRLRVSPSGRYLNANPYRVRLADEVGFMGHQDYLPGEFRTLTAAAEAAWAELTKREHPLTRFS